MGENLDARRHRGTAGRLFRHLPTWRSTWAHRGSIRVNTSPAQGSASLLEACRARLARQPEWEEHLLGRAVWDQDGVGDDIRDDLIEHLGDPGVVLVDETGGLRKAPPPWACSARDTAPPAGSRTRGSRSCWWTPARLRWSLWRRRQQACTRACHYHRHANEP
jgi:hypothetical protein